MKTKTAPVENVTVALSPTSRCDRCGSRAFVMAKHFGLADLLFCAHHGREHSKQLTVQGWMVTDHTWKLHQEETDRQRNLPVELPGKKKRDDGGGGALVR